MPYYCTVPRCTSMAGKAKNVSFHQFPRDEELAKLWNKILKRGKPYTKYSKVCSLHFRPEDYTITSVGKNRGTYCLFYCSGSILVKFAIAIVFWKHYFAF